MKTKNAASTVTVVRPKYGMARHKQQVRSGWAVERHKQRAGSGGSLESAVGGSSARGEGALP